MESVIFVVEKISFIAENCNPKLILAPEIVVGEERSVHLLSLNRKSDQSAVSSVLLCK